MSLRLLVVAFVGCGFRDSEFVRLGFVGWRFKGLRFLDLRFVAFRFVSLGDWGSWDLRFYVFGFRIVIF